jgi:hypothetical protein
MKKHPPVYYTIRTAVRTLVWGGLALGTLAIAIEATDDDRPTCDIRIVSPTRWEANSPSVDVSKCVAPAYMVLNQGGTWEWVTE